MSISEPDKITTPWASTGSKNPIPANANNTTGAAGFDNGFPDITMTPEEAGGLPPAGQDFNGIFYEITKILQYMQAGGQPTFSAALASGIGGYPVGAMVLGDDGVAIYTNRVDSNISNPNSGGSGWARSDLMLREALRRSYAEAGYNLVDGSFEAGGTLVNANDVLLQESTGKAYSGTGSFPQTVPSDSTPGAGFTDRSSALLKTTVDLLRSDFDDYSHNDTNQRIGNGVLITAHRSGGVGTENSIMNYQKMMETGMYDGIELDMCISADGVLYNFHDRDVSIQTNGTGLFYELNSSYIDTLRYTATEGTSIAGEQIPKLHEVLRVAADFDCWVNAEIKFMRMDGGVDRYTDIHIMIDALKAAGVFEKCMLGAFNINYLTTAINYDKFSSINRYIFQGEYTNSDVDQLAALPSKGLKFMSLFYTDFTPAIAEYMRSKGVIPGVWTPNDPMQQETAIADGARIINSDAWGLGNLGGKK